MNGRILAVLLVVLGLSVGTEGQLACQKKDYAVIEALSDAVNCAPGELCFTLTAYQANIALKMYKKGCMAADQCTVPPRQETIAAVPYTVNTTCCSTNLCNHAQTLRMTVWGGIVSTMLFIFMFV